jgi:DNA-binding IclR family transcriptional regulator
MNKYIIPNLRKACQVLDTLAQEPDGLTVSEASERLDLPRTTALRIFSTLCVEGMARKTDGRYYAGSSLVRAGLGALSNFDVRAIAIPVMQNLTRKTEETSHLAIPAEDRALIVEVCDSPHPLRMASRPGTLAPLYISSLGKIFLASVFYDRLDSILVEKELEAKTEKTLTTIPEIKEEIERVRALGYAVDDEENLAGVRCIAAPVYDAHGDVVAAVGITGVVPRFTREKFEEFAGCVIVAGREISHAMGADLDLCASESLECVDSR